MFAVDFMAAKIRVAVVERLGQLAMAHHAQVQHLAAEGLQQRSDRV